MPAARKVSLQQLEILISFMEDHIDVAKGQAVDTPQAKAAVRSLWEELAATLNAQGTGVHKKSTEWRDYWRDMKYRIKKKAGEREVDRRRTGGGPAAHESLSDYEQRVFAIIGKRAVFGDEAVRIPFDPPVEHPQMPATSPPPSPIHYVEIDVAADPPLQRPVSPLPSTSASGLIGSPAAEATAPAAKRRKKSASGTRGATSVELPQPRWAWEAEQSRLALDERRLRVEERLADSLSSISETLISIRDEIRQLRESRP